jgi:hypothetical protein
MKLDRDYMNSIDRRLQVLETQTDSRFKFLKRYIRSWNTLNPWHAWCICSQIRSRRLQGPGSTKEYHPGWREHEGIRNSRRDQHS